MFKMPKGEKVYSFMRGFMNARLMALTISPHSGLLALTSNRGTLHVFEMERFSQRSAMTKANSEVPDSGEGCCALDAVKFVGTKLMSLLCCREVDTLNSRRWLHYSLARSIMKHHDGDFSADHILALTDNGKVE